MKIRFPAKNGYYWHRATSADEWKIICVLNGCVTYIGSDLEDDLHDLANGEFVEIHEPVEN